MSCMVPEIFSCCVFFKAVHNDLSSLRLFEEGGGFAFSALCFCRLADPSSPVLWQLSRGHEKGDEFVMCI